MEALLKRKKKAMKGEKKKGTSSDVSGETEGPKTEKRQKRGCPAVG